MHALAGLGRHEIVRELYDIVREGVFVGLVAPERAHGELVRTRRAAQAQIDTAGIERGERTELLGDHQRRMVRQHHPAGADADGFRAAGDVADHDGGRGTRDAGHVVMLGEPVALVAECFGVLREVAGIGESIGGRAAFDHGREVENGEGNFHFLPRHALPCAGHPHLACVDAVKAWMATELALARVLNKIIIESGRPDLSDKPGHDALLYCTSRS